MIDRALLYLLAMRLKNSGRRLLAQPGRLALLAVAIGLFVLVIVSGGPAEGVSGIERHTLLATLLAFNLLLSVVTGLGENGLGFSAADLDHVFPAPLPRRAVLAYHLLRHYAGLVLLALLYTAFLGLGRLEQPVLAYLAILLCLATCTHVQAACTLLAASLSERLFARLKRAARSGLFLLLGGGAVLALLALKEGGHVTALLGEATAARPVRLALLPAFAAADAAFATSLAEAWIHVLVVGAIAAATFAVGLLFRVNFLETSFATTEARSRRQVAVRASSRGPRLWPTSLAGASAVAWVNALTLLRRPRLVLGPVLMLFLLLLVSRPGRGEVEGVPQAVVLLAFFALMAHVPVGFRAHREHLALLKTVPVGARQLALAEVLVPVLLIWGLQLLVLLLYVAAGALEAPWLLVGVLAFPLLDVGVIALIDLFQLGRDPRRAGLLATMLQLVTLLVVVLPAVFAAVLLDALTGSVALTVAGALLVQAGVDLVLLGLLGRRFASFDLSREGL